jgi:BASS family bile acid:Na+ symporter
MHPILDLLVPAVLVLLMLVVGLGLTGADLLRVRDRAGLIVLATLIQIVALPALAAGLIRLFEPEAPIAAGLVLLAACPGGALSNYYCHLARADVAFSVALTAFASLASLVTLPLAIGIGFTLLGRTQLLVAVPMARILLQLLLFVLLPIVTGMLTRARWPAGTLRWLPTLNLGGTVALLALLAAIFAEHRSALDNGDVGVFLLAAGFTVLCFAVGSLVGRLLRLRGPTVASLAFEFSIRNLAIQAMVAVVALGQPEYLLFGAVFLVIQAPLALLAAGLLRLNCRHVSASR